MTHKRQAAPVDFDRRTFMRGALAAAALAAARRGARIVRRVRHRAGRRRRRRRRRSGQQPVRPGRRLDRRRGDLQRRLRLRLRDLRGRHGQEEPPGGHAQRRPLDADRAAAAAPLRRRQPARPHRQLGCGARSGSTRSSTSSRRWTTSSPRTTSRAHHLVHPVRRRQGSRHLQRQVPGPQLRPHPLRRLVLAEPVRREQLDPAEDVGRGQGPRRQGQGEGQVPLRLGQGGGDATTTRSPWTPPSRRAAPRCVSRWRTSTRSAGRSRPSSRSSPRWASASRTATSSPAARAPSSPRRRPSGATTSRRCSTPRARGSRTR